MASSVTLTGGEGLHTFTVPFTFNGVVTAFGTPVPGPDDPPIFTATLVGSGSARAAFSGRDVGVDTASCSIRFHFRVPITSWSTCSHPRRRYRSREPCCSWVRAL
jgi:hypothetical protein